MKHLEPILTFSPDCKGFLENYLCNDDNLEEFLKRMGAIIFSKDSTFFYSPVHQNYIIEIFDCLEDKYHQDEFLGLLENAQETTIDDDKIFIELFDYGNYQEYHEVEKGLIFSELFCDGRAVGLIDFNRSKTTNKQYKEFPGDDSPIISTTVLPTYKDFVEWRNDLVPRVYDRTYTKHLTPDYENPDNWKKYATAMRCSVEEAEKVIKIAFYKKSHHEHHLFYYHKLDYTEAVLFFKTEVSNRNYHAYHLEKKKVQKNYQNGIFKV